ncbi:chemotaxis protein [Commensalibacter oyaizuii]|uniref:Chemotaxis protein n=1 Tax=Commensalibacter oyaizuii TaxID=3043873 RepID=A0ABT6Q2G6_9PROT|nr:chemotaxis protein [Commensalibacter sp. TBRC 16381]MDI2091325.1 chemotaxis protein [Commensalibacter sp. TBRC 16381]
MPLPFILLGGAATLTAIGGKKTYDGYQAKKLANQILRDTKDKYEKRKSLLDDINNIASKKLENLGKLQLNIGKSFDECDQLVVEILQNRKVQNYAHVDVNVPQHKLDEIRQVAISAIGYLSTIVGGGISSAAAGFAVYGGVMTFAAASTGTSIASLSGVAAYNATMAAIGGGSLATGGWGMAGGAMVLGASVVAPILAVGGIAYAIHGTKSYNKAHETLKEVDEACAKMSLARSHLTYIINAIDRIYLLLNKINNVFQEYFESLKEINVLIKNKDKEQIEKLSESATLTIDNGYKLAAMMANIISKPLFKTKNNGLEILTDENGFQILDTKGLDLTLSNNQTEFDAFQKLN